MQKAVDGGKGRDYLLGMETTNNTADNMSNLDLTKQIAINLHNRTDLAAFVGASDRHTMIAGLTAAIIRTGEQHDTSNTRTRRAQFLDRMDLLDAAATTLVLVDCAPAYRGA